MGAEEADMMVRKAKADYLRARATDCRRKAEAYRREAEDYEDMACRAEQPK